MVEIQSRLKIVAVGLSSISLSLVKIGEKARAMTAIAKTNKLNPSVRTLFSDKALCVLFSLEAVSRLFLVKLMKR